MTMVLVAAERARLRAWLVPLTVSVLFFISTQYVNTSTLYVAVALLLFLVFIPYGERVGPGIFFATPSSTSSPPAWGRRHRTSLSMGMPRRLANTSKGMAYATFYGSIPAPPSA